MLTLTHNRRISGFYLINIAINLFVAQALFCYFNASDAAASFQLFLLGSLTQLLFMTGLIIVLTDAVTRNPYQRQKLAALSPTQWAVVCLDASLLATILILNYGLLTIVSFKFGASFERHVRHMDIGTLSVMIGLLWGVFRLTYRVSRWALLKRTAVRNLTAAS